MADPDNNKNATVQKVEVTNCGIVVIGDNNIITSSEDNDVKDANQTLSTVRLLPGKPFHKCFVREKEVERIFSLYEEMSNTRESCVTTVFLSGPPGSGKTQLARQFGEKFLESTPMCENYLPVVLTLNAESVKSLLESTKKILNKFPQSKKDEVLQNGKDVDIMRSYMENLREDLLKQYPGKWLLILDNLFRDEEIFKILPPASEDWDDGMVLVTTQDCDIVPYSHENARNYSLKSGMDKTDALELLCKVSGIEVDEFAVELAKELEYYPLSLACSATYVGQMLADRPTSGFSWKHFLEMYRRQQETLTYRTFAQYNVYPHSMMVAARLSVKRLSECSDTLRFAFDFLSYCALSPVPLVIISTYVEARLPSESRSIPSDEIKAEISRCSLLGNEPSGFLSVETVSFHQVMREAFKYVRDESFRSDHQEKRNNYVLMLESLKKSLDAAIPKYDSTSVSFKMLASSHLKSVVDFGKSNSWDKSADFVIILVFLADSLYHVPGVTETQRIKYAESARDIAQRLPEPMKDLRLAQLLKSLGFYYREADRLDKSVDVLKEALALTENQNSDDWLEVRSEILNVLSWTYKLQMKLDLAEQKMKESIEVAKIVFGEEHEEIVKRLCNLAIIYREKYEMATARETADEARRIAKKALADEWHLTKAQAANFSAKIYLRCAEISENGEEKHELLTTSQALHAEALNIYENVLGQNHIYVAGVCMTYAMVYKELKEYDQATKLVERAEKIFDEVKQVQLSIALTYKTELLLVAGNASKAIEAEKVIKKSLELSSSGRGRFLLAQTYLQQKRFYEARCISNEVLTRWKSGVLPSNHIWVKHAEKIKAECDWGLAKIYIPKILTVVFLFFAILIAWWVKS